MIEALVSVIIPCYNAQATLVHTLDSTLAQSFQDFCIIAVDDGSHDSTGDILNNFAQRYPKKILVIRQANKGQTVAKNIAIQNSQSEYIAFLDSDDLWTSDKLNKQIELLKSNSNIGLCYTAAYKIDTNGVKVGIVKVSSSYRGYCLDELILGNNIVASSVMVQRKAVVQVGGFDERLRAGENWDLWIRIASKYELEYIDEPLISYRIHQSNMSNNFEKMFRARLQIIDKHLPLLSEDSEVKAKRKESLFKAHLSFAKGHIDKLRLSDARHELLQAMRIKPKQKDCYFLYLKTLLGPRIFKWIRSQRSGYYS